MRHLLSIAVLAISWQLYPALANGEDSVRSGIVYSSVNGQELKLDLATPDGDGPFPAIVFIHGGGWHSGNRSTYSRHIVEAAERGYVAATISYRLMQFDEEHRDTATAAPIFPAQVHDVKAAIRWLRAHADQYHVDPERIGVTGASAGGHLSLMLGLTDPTAALEGHGGHEDHSSRVQAVVNYFGPTEFLSGYEASSVPWILRLFMGGEPGERRATYLAASPVNYASSDDPPVLTLHGDQDELVPIDQARLLDQRLKAVGVDHTLVILEGQGHGFSGESQSRAAELTWEFFENHLKRP